MSNDGEKLSKQKYTQSINKKNCNADSVLCAIHMEHCTTVLEAADIWLKTFDPAAFMPHIRNELQALRAHPVLEDTAFMGGMACFPSNCALAS